MLRAATRKVKALSSPFYASQSMNNRKRVQVCVPVCERSIEDMKQTAARARTIGDIVELRLDCLAETEFTSSMPQLRRWLSSLDSQTILTLRPAEQGGRVSFERKHRSDFFNLLVSDSLLDIELDLVQDLSSKERDLDWNRVICSHHDFAGVSAHLDQIYDQMCATPARVLKIAVEANDATDCLPVFELLDRARKEG